MSEDEKRLTPGEKWAMTRPAAAALIKAFMDGDQRAYTKIMQRWAHDPEMCAELTMTVGILAGGIITGAVGGDKDKASDLVDTWVTDAVHQYAGRVDAEQIAATERPHAA